MSFLGRWRAVAASGVVIGGWAVAMGQQATTLALPPAPLLPAQVGAWQQTTDAPGCLDCYHPSGTTEAVLNEDGLKRGVQASYRQAQGHQTLAVTALQFGDATGAVAAFDFLRRPEMRDLPKERRIGSATAVSGDDYLVWTGTSVLEAKGASAKNEDDLRRLAAGLPKISGPKGAAPLLPTLLPAKGLVAGSVRYTLGPTGYQAGRGVLPAGILEFDKAAEAVTADYSTKDGKGVLTLLLYPTPQIAGDSGRAIVAWANEHHDELGTVKMRREGPLLIVTSGRFPANEAQQIVDGIHLRSEVTWDKPMPLEFHSEVRKTASLLTSILVLSGVLMLAAVLLGFFLGFGRAGVRVLMGKPAAIEPEFLGLGLARGPSAKARLKD